MVYVRVSQCWNVSVGRVGVCMRACACMCVTHVCCGCALCSMQWPLLYLRGVRPCSVARRARCAAGCGEAAHAVVLIGLSELARVRQSCVCVCVCVSACMCVSHQVGLRVRAVASRLVHTLTYVPRTNTRMRILVDALKRHKKGPN